MNKKHQYILFLPCIVLISYFMIIPLLGTILPTFTDVSNGMFSAYTEFLKDEYMMSILYRTIKVSLISSIICMLIGVPVSYYISRTSKKLRGLFIALTVFPILTIENDLLEAAESLGANKIVAFFKVIFPLSLPGLIVGTVLVFTGALTAYTTPQLLGGNKNTVLATLIYQKTMTLGDWQGAAVVATIMIVVTLIVVKTINFLASRLDKRGVS